jgi:hypothetical protein
MLASGKFERVVPAASWGTGSSGAAKASARKRATLIARRSRLTFPPFAGTIRWRKGSNPQPDQSAFGRRQCHGLENRRGGNSAVGSNPAPSATKCGYTLFLKAFLKQANGSPTFIPTFNAGYGVSEIVESLSNEQLLAA